MSEPTHTINLWTDGGAVEIARGRFLGGSLDAPGLLRFVDATFATEEVPGARLVLNLHVKGVPMKRLPKAGARVSIEGVDGGRFLVLDVTADTMLSFFEYEIRTAEIRGRVQGLGDVMLEVRSSPE